MNFSSPHELFEREKCVYDSFVCLKILTGIWGDDCLSSPHKFSLHSWFSVLCLKTLKCIIIKPYFYVLFVFMLFWFTIVRWVLLWILVYIFRSLIIFALFLLYWGEEVFLRDVIDSIKSRENQFFLNIWLNKLNLLFCGFIEVENLLKLIN